MTVSTQARPAGAELAAAGCGLLVSHDPSQLARLGSQGMRRRDQGVLGIAAPTIIGATELRRQIRGLFRWGWSAARFEIDADGPVQVGIDGEGSTMDPQPVFEAMPGAFPVRLPHCVIEMSPAARRGEDPALHNLDVARGTA